MGRQRGSRREIVLEPPRLFSEFAALAVGAAAHLKFRDRVCLSTQRRATGRIVDAENTGHQTLLLDPSRGRRIAQVKPIPGQGGSPHSRQLHLDMPLASTQ